MTKFGELIKKIREEKGLSVAELAQKCGISSVEIRNIEKGNNKPHISRLKSIADALEYDYIELYNVLIQK